MKVPPKPEALKITQFHSAQLVRLQFHMIIIPLTHSCAIRGYGVAILTPVYFFAVPASLTPPYLLRALALVDAQAVGEAA